MKSSRDNDKRIILSSLLEFDRIRPVVLRTLPEDVESCGLLPAFDWLGLLAGGGQ